MSIARGLRLLGLAQLGALAACSVMVDLSELDQGCAPDEKLCDGACVTAADPETGCARQGCQPCALPHATPTCAGDGTCAIAACIGSNDDCDNDAENGCEVDLDNDLEHCGSCDARPCEVDNAEPACGSGSCAIRRCNPGFRDCNQSTRDGCEVDTRTNEAHCGACRMPCGDGETCTAGTCG
ncbi:MAG TPA: hypothetical protein VFZ53_11430 [Polyangiaceae bacterium]